MSQSPSYKELLAQREALDAQIKQIRSEELAGAVSQARELVKQYELTVADIFPAGRKASAAKGGTVAPKYRDPATGATWTGRGKAPLWIASESDRSKFAI